ncbi:Abortive infection protein [Thalassoporum mexicanum PCC 7367]|uniref:CPBP family intramembrane glutamic endopeptidase n=1 Tax=Thalassoporum mexicanum TaxID=3457544 RepID=UPI00029FFD85|nr:type II CAAX endopeptidase family protein [Pseudanabaena sp. PCC 7367]AFY68412.1 Abortive infection protein [Pseudanabaena sp. PCC 7367]
MKRVILSILSVLAIAFLGLTLANSWTHPQVQTRLDLMQTDVVLEALQWQPEEGGDTARQILIGGSSSNEYYQQALEKYLTVRQAGQEELAKINQLLQQRSITAAQSSRLNQQYQEQDASLAELDVNIGLLMASLDRPSQALSTWEITAQNQPIIAVDPSAYALTAQVLRGLWNEPILLLPEAERQINTTLSGWFRNQALEKLYRSQQRQESLQELVILRQEGAIQAFNRIALANAVPILGGGLGLVLWVYLGIRRLVAAERSWLQLTDQDRKWPVPWDGEETWEVMLLWFTAFVGISQILLPVVLGLLRLIPDDSWQSRDRAIFVLLSYVAYMSPVLIILQQRLKPFMPLPETLFRLKLNPPSWLGWGIGGYLTAIPMVFVASVLSEQLLQGNGGGNPLLEILADNNDGVAKIVLWLTLAVAAPFFEEILFRGFLLPSLTKLMPFWAALCLSGLTFAVTHQNLSDIIPLTILGIVLGFVYVRSKNLLAPMLLHCLWNSGSFLSLLALNG